MFAIGQLVIFTPRPSYGINWPPEVLANGCVARVTSVTARPTYFQYAVQRRDSGKHPFNDYHWSCSADELRELDADDCLYEAWEAPMMSTYATA